MSILTSYLPTPVSHPSPAVVQADDTAPTSEARLRQSAEEFEAVFIAEMLNHAGLDDAVAGETGFGGEAYAGLLVDAYADALAKNGGFGLAEQIYQQLKGEVS